MRIYQRTQYEQLARSVLAGFPMAEAEKILEDLRVDLEVAKKEWPEVNYQSEEPAFWLELQKGSSSNFTSIQVSKSTKDILESLKQDKDKGKETYEDVVVRLVERNRELGGIEIIKINERARDEAINCADELVAKIKICKDLKEHTELIDELSCYCERLENAGHILGEDIGRKALEYWEFGFKSMSCELENCSSGETYGSTEEEYDLYNEYYQRIESLKRDLEKKEYVLKARR